MPIILVVDDSLSVRKVAERMLREAGLEVALAANGEDAITWMSSNQPDLVIADVIMPDKSGFEVCAFVRARPKLANTPVLLISGFVDDEVTRQAEACRADGVVKKPFQGASLRERVETLLAARKQPEALAPAPAIEMPALAPEPELTLSIMPPAPAPAAAPELVLEMPVIAPGPAAASPGAPPAPAAAPELVLEMPVIAPEPVAASPGAPLSPAPAPEAAPVPVAATAPTAQLEDEVRAILAATQGLDARVTEQERGRDQLERQLQAFRESTTQSFKELSAGDQLEALHKRLAEQETRLAELEKQSAELLARIADLEPAAASAKQLIQTLAEFARQALKPGEGGAR